MTMNIQCKTADTLSPDLFVSIRVGELQKFSKLAASKVFKFPKSAVDGKRIGKMDIFKRVGSANIGIAPDTYGSGREVSFELGSQDCSLRTLRFQVCPCFRTQK